MLILCNKSHGSGPHFPTILLFVSHQIGSIIFILKSKIRHFSPSAGSKWRIIFNPNYKFTVLKGSTSPNVLFHIHTLHNTAAAPSQPIYTALTVTTGLYFSFKSSSSACILSAEILMSPLVGSSCFVYPSSTRTDPIPGVALPGV